MNRLLLYLGLLLTLVGPHASRAGYKNLVDQFNAYTPPGDIVVERYQPEGPQDPVESQSPRFTQELDHIQKISADWRKALSGSVGPRPLFFTPEATLLKKYHGAASDSAIASNALRGAFDLATLETLAWIRNPAIQSAQNKLAASIASFSQVANLDEILRQYAAFTADIKTGVGPMKGQDSVKTKFPFPGMVTLKGQIVQRQTEAAWQSLELVRRDVITTVRQTYWDLVFNRKAQKITADTLILFENLETVATRRYEAGRTSFQDVVKIQVRTKVLQEDLVTLKEEQRSIASRLTALLNMPPTKTIGTPAFVGTEKRIPPVEGLYPVAQNHRQEILLKQAQLKKMQHVLEMAETMVVPAYTLNYSTYDNQAINTVGSAAPKPPFQTSMSASRGAGLPRNIGYGTNDAYIREIREQVSALKASLANTRAETANQVRERWFALDRAFREKILYRDTVVGLSRSALEVSTSGYESGNVSFADVISSYGLWLSSNLMLEKKRSEYFTAWVKLEQAVGKQL